MPEGEIHVTRCACMDRTQWEQDECRECGGWAWIGIDAELEQLNRQAAGEPQEH